ncbi:J domain-containing protein [Leptolyngbya sp. FACHB-36]|uniref:DnaJ C-terminal domain-containing protein n=1 Tax=Leptolyngbya sp. FACHB-36 TaxID=2692808 RepID=UPI0016815896|nr:J domain-containing protein [Leptolyngbya sp. FACHB-36]MBD2020718.1 J domain-containing protein [Leptolyngbya sp. FACHB-36]
MQNFRNYYDILGVSKDATADEIKNAFRRLARKYHPDVNPGDKDAEEKFKALNEANEVLSDADKRAQYDQFGRFWQQRGFQNGAGAAGRSTGRSWNGRSDRASSDTVNFAEFDNFNAFVDQLLNRRTAQSGSSTSGSSSREAFRPGTTKTATVYSRPTRRDAEARLTVPLEKAYVGGRERIRLEDGRSLEVTMPSGMITGQRIRLKGQGVAGGDLYLKIEVDPHPFFKLEGTDIRCQLPITPSEAVLGGQIEVPTLDGLVKMTIPPGVGTGKRLRLANKGYPKDGDDRGDQIVEIQIVIPKDLTDQERELYEKLRQMETFNPRAELLV